MLTVVCLDRDNQKRYAFVCDRRDIPAKLSQATGIPAENITIDPAEKCIQSDVLFVHYTIHDNEITLYFKFPNYDFQDCMTFEPETPISKVIDDLARKYNTKPGNVELYFNSRMLTRKSGRLIDHGICHGSILQVFFLEKRRMLLFYRNQCALEQDQIRFFASEDDWHSVLQARLLTSNFEIADSEARIGADPFRQPEERLTVVIAPQMRQPVKLSQSQGRARSVFWSRVKPEDTAGSLRDRMTKSLGLTCIAAPKHHPNESLETTRKAGDVIEIEVDAVKVVTILVSGSTRWSVTSNEAPTGEHLIRYAYQQYFSQSYEMIKRARGEVPNLIQLFWTSTESGKSVVHLVTENMTFNDFPQEVHLSVLYRFDFGRLTVDRYLKADQSNKDLLTYARTQLWKGNEKDIWSCTCRRESHMNIARLHIHKPKEGKRDALEVAVRMGQMDWNSGVRFRDGFSGKISVEQHNRDYLDVIRANLATNEDSVELMVEDVSLHLFGQPLVRLVPLDHIAKLRNIVLEVFVSPLYSYHVMVNQMLRMEATVRFPRSATCDHVCQHFRKIYGESVSLTPSCDGYGDANWYEFLQGECHFVVNVVIRSDSDGTRRTIYQSLNSHYMASCDSNVFDRTIKDNQIESSISNYIITKFGTKVNFCLDGKSITELKNEVEEKFLANVELTFDGRQDSEVETLDSEHLHVTFIARTLSFEYISSNMNEQLTTLRDVKIS